MLLERPGSGLDTPGGGGRLFDRGAVGPDRLLPLGLCCRYRYLRSTKLLAQLLDPSPGLIERQLFLCRRANAAKQQPQYRSHTDPADRRRGDDASSAGRCQPDNTQSKTVSFAGRAYSPSLPNSFIG
jgi:hypothetical protein